MKRGSEPHKYLGESVLTEGMALRCPSGHKRVKEVTSGGGGGGGSRWRQGTDETGSCRHQERKCGCCSQRGGKLPELESDMIHVFNRSLWLLLGGQTIGGNQEALRAGWP